jgi:hypothetical protein
MRIADAARATRCGPNAAGATATSNHAAPYVVSMHHNGVVIRESAVALEGNRVCRGFDEEDRTA